MVGGNGSGGTLGGACLLNHGFPVVLPHQILEAGGENHVLVRFPRSHRQGGDQSGSEQRTERQRGFLLDFWRSVHAANDPRRGGKEQEDCRDEQWDEGDESRFVFVVEIRASPQHPEHKGGWHDESHSGEGSFESEHAVRQPCLEGEECCQQQRHQPRPAGRQQRPAAEDAPRAPRFAQDIVHGVGRGGNITFLFSAIEHVAIDCTEEKDKRGKSHTVGNASCRGGREFPFARGCFGLGRAVVRLLGITCFPRRTIQRLSAFLCFLVRSGHEWIKNSFALRS